MLRLFFTTLFLFNCSISFASGIGFRDLIIGRDRVDLISNSKERLVECNGDVCEYEASIKGADVSIFCFIKDEKLYFIRVEFDPFNYPEIKRAMMEKWGKPKSVTKQKLTNLFGVSALSEKILWYPVDGIVTLCQYEDLTKGTAVIGGTEFISNYNSYRAAKKHGEGF